MILVWLNNNNGTCYTKTYKTHFLFNYYVGYINSYTHEVIQILILKDNKLINCKSYNDYILISSRTTTRNKVLTFIKKLI